MAITESKYSYSKRNGIEKVNIKVDKKTPEQEDSWNSGSTISPNEVPTDQCTKAGDPVNVATGSFYIEATDLLIEDRGLDLSVIRRYNSIETNID